jgi:hypothetical protein
MLNKDALVSEEMQLNICRELFLRRDGLGSYLITDLRDIGFCGSHIHDAGDCYRIDKIVETNALLNDDEDRLVSRRRKLNTGSGKGN